MPQLKIALALKPRQEQPHVLIANELAHLNQEQDADAKFSLCIGLWIGLLVLIGAVLSWLTM